MDEGIQWDDDPKSLISAFFAELVLALGTFAYVFWMKPRFGLLISLVSLVLFGYLLSKLAPHALRMKLGKQSRLTYAMLLFVPLVFGFILPLIFDSPYFNDSEGFIISIGIGLSVGSAYLLIRLLASLLSKPSA
ncbi:hypothetical protein [Litorimonas sp.]|uniref:hypothetical protein n=1 Tax=Litorimonas sp. TaxID=1892381 RepID=UPI003A87FF08